MDAPGSGLTVAEAADVVAAAAPYLESWLALQREQLRVPGVQAAVRVGGRLVLSAALGLADASTGEPLTREHVFRVASLSKWFTATAVLRLVDAGRLRLDDALGHWVPQLAERAPDVAAVTVRQALGHTGGIVRDARDSDYWQLLRPFPDAEEVLAITADSGTASGTDEQFTYSNTTYSLLGLVVEAVTGTPCAEHVQRDVVDRLGLTRTTTDPGPGTRPLVAGHTALLPGESERLVIASARTATGAMAPAAGFASTAEDLTLFGASSSTGPGLLSAASERLQRRRESVLSAHGQEPRAYGLGVELHTLRGRDLLGHAGGWPGQISRTFVDTDAQLAVSVLTNAIDGPADALARGLLALVDLALAGAERRGGAPAGEDAGLAGRTGRFANLWEVVDVALLGGRLFLLHPTDSDPYAGHSELELVDGALRSQRTPDPGSISNVVEQVRDAAGAVESARINGVSHWPLEVFLARRADQVAGSAG